MIFIRDIRILQNYDIYVNLQETWPSVPQYGILQVCFKLKIPEELNSVPKSEIGLIRIW